MLREGAQVCRAGHVDAVRALNHHGSTSGGADMALRHLAVLSPFGGLNAERAASTITASYLVLSGIRGVYGMHGNMIGREHVYRAALLNSHHLANQPQMRAFEGLMLNVLPQLSEPPTLC